MNNIEDSLEYKIDCVIDMLENIDESMSSEAVHILHKFNYELHKLFFNHLNNRCD